MSMDIRADCSRRFYPAAHSSGKRTLSQIKWIVLHDEEAPTAASAAAYFQSRHSGGSAHLCVDDKDCFRCLANQTIPWGAASAFGANTHGFHIEQGGYAKWLPGRWMLHRKTLERAAYKTAFHCHKFGIPVEFVTADKLPRRFGITTHAEITRASKRLDPRNAWMYDHTDPGRFWPRRWFMNRVRAYYAEL